MQSKKTVVIISLVVLFLLITGLWVKSSFNGMVEADEEVSAEWSKVETQYQRRMDLIPNLVGVVKGYASHEKETLTAVMNARSRATNITIDPSNLTEENMAQYQRAQNQVSASLGRLMMVREQYPNLKADARFSELQAELEGTENRIAVARDRFNEVAKVYNILIRKFPKNMMASMFGFSIKPYFVSQEGADEAPKVEF